MNTDTKSKQTTVDTELFNFLDKKLSLDIDTEILKGLDLQLELVRKKSKALASSLVRCFENARKSMRYVLVYRLGEEDAKNRDGDEELEKYLGNYLKDYFEKNDFMHYREFVRLNRACAIDVGVDVSSKIKDMYNNFFLGQRLIKAYKFGKNLN